MAAPCAHLIVVDSVDGRENGGSRGSDAPHAELIEAIDAALGGNAVVGDLRRLSGGASRETWAFSAIDPATGGRRRLILQRRQPGPGGGGPSMAVEDRLLDAAGATGVPLAPTIVDAATAEPHLGEARITGFLDGEVLGPRLVRAERSDAGRVTLARRFGAALAAIHAVDHSGITGLETVDPIERLRTGLDLAEEARPIFELTLRWLEANRPEPGPPTVVHGDFRVGNLVVAGSDLRAVLDWELAHIGDPAEDLGWLCVRAWRFGGAHEVGGIGDLDDLLAGYHEAGGRPTSPEVVHWWLVAGTATWGLICAIQARRHLDGHVRSVELATIGRRVCETEYDLAQLLDLPTGDDEGRATPDVDGDQATAAGLHGRPTATELVEAVRSHLADNVAPGLEGLAGFHLKVAANALAMVERELRTAPAVEAACARRLEAIGYPDEAALAAAIRAGTVDDAASGPTGAAIRATIADRVRVASPRWLQGADQPA